MKKAGKISLSVIAGFLLVFICIILIKTVTLKSFQYSSNKNEANLPFVDSEMASKHLAGALSIKTISFDNRADFDLEAFRQFNIYLEKTYPVVHKAMTKERVNELTVLYKWQGKNESLKPMLLLAHQDVVQVEAGTEKDWKYPAFQGTVVDGYIYGRGSLDIKNNLIAIMEAAEYLASSGFTPERTLYISMGHDEEIGGDQGNRLVAELLASRNIKLSAVLDEGGSLVKGIVPGVDQYVALVGIAEKGYLSLELVATAAGGHSSTPPKHSAAGKISAAVCKLENHPFSGSYDGPAKLMFDYLAPEMPFGLKMVFGNSWCFRPLIEKIFNSTPSTNAMLRTSTAVTVINSGTKDNILPQKAKAIVNFRMKPGCSIEDVVAHTKKIINDDTIKISIVGSANPATPVSNVNSAEFISLQKTINKVFPDAIAAPYLVLGGTDSRYFTEISDQVFRFVAVRMQPEDLDRMHGTDERVGVESFKESIQFMIEYIKVMN